VSPSTVLVTGGSSGIGYALAERFAKAGHALILVARDAERLERAAAALRAGTGAAIETIACDLSEPDAPRALNERLERDGRAVDILVNNAGFGVLGPFAESDPDLQRRMIFLNVAALTALTRLLLPAMVARRRGGILNVASTAAFQSGPLFSVYYASKAYVVSFSQAIARELKGSGIAVTVLCPGPTKTEFQSRARMLESNLMRAGRMEVSKVAEAGYLGLMRGTPLVIPGIMNRVLAMLTRWAPPWIVTEIVWMLHQRKPKA
jgi:short-subunit dehydrogenase